MKEKKQFLVTARKWRPMKFSDVVGQEHVTRTLMNAIKNERIHHAYLFCGPRGVGKTTTARILARVVNFPDLIDKTPDEADERVREALKGRSLDIIEIDGASNNSVDDVRALRENAKYPPALGKYKMYIIDEVHMLSTSAFNALLKILEEPPPHLIFVFATTEIHKVPATIISRTQRFDFRRMETADMIDRLKLISDKEGISIDEQSLITIARKADGSMRDSQSIFDQVVAFCGNDIKYSEMAEALNLIDEEFFFEITAAIKARDTAKMFVLVDKASKLGYDNKEIVSGLLEHLRNILTVLVTKDTVLIESSQHIADLYRAAAKEFSKNDLLRLVGIAGSVEQEMRFAPQPRIKLELALAKMASMAQAVEIEELINEIRTLKKNSKLKEPPPSESQGSEIHGGKPLTEPQKPRKTAQKAKDETGLVKFLVAQEFMTAEVKLFDAKSAVLSGDTLEIQATTEINHSYLSEKQSELESLASEYFGQQIKIKLNPKSENASHLSSALSSESIGISHAGDKSKAENKDINAVSSPANESKEISRDEKPLHPIEKDLIELFDAKKLDL